MSKESEILFDELNCIHIFKAVSKSCLSSPKERLVIILFYFLFFEFIINFNYYFFKNQIK